MDFSADSAEATRVAVDLAQRFDASLTLIHVYDPLVCALPDGFVMTPAGADGKAARGVQGTTR